MEPINWPRIFDLISSEYGWTSDYIWTRTAREISWRLDQIDFRTAQDFRMSALLHRGIDLPPIEEPGSEAKEAALTLEDLQVIQRNKSNFMKRKAEEINGR